jgi:hypothetical protein
VSSDAEGCPATYLCGLRAPPYEKNAPRGPAAGEKVSTAPPGAGARGPPPPPDHTTWWLVLPGAKNGLLSADHRGALSTLYDQYMPSVVPLRSRDQTALRRPAAPPE